MLTRREFEQAVQSRKQILAEGAVIERLRRESAMPLDRHLLNASFVYTDAGRAALGRIYREYLSIGASFDLPMIVLAPTWRASALRVRAAGLEDGDVNGDGVRFLRGVVAELGTYAEEVLLGGLMACAGDAYKPEDSLRRDEAAEYHRPQAEALAAAGVDFIQAATLPAFEEAAGMAEMLAELDIAYVLSFVIRPDGTLLDGTALATAVDWLDDQLRRPPSFYMVNCVHPSHFLTAMREQIRVRPGLMDRVLGLQANTSRQAPEELDGSDELDASDPDEWAAAMLDVQDHFLTRILGGCCGTGRLEIAALARRMAGARDAAATAREVPK